MAGMIRFRSADLDDAKPLIVLSEYIVDTSYRSFLDDELVDSFIRRKAVHKYTSLNLGYYQLLMLGDEILGFTVCRENQIDLMMVDPRVQGFGLSTQLLEYSERRLFKSSPVLGLRSFAANHGANEFFRNNGWEDMVAHTDKETGLREYLFRKVDPLRITLHRHRHPDLGLSDSGNRHAV